MMTVSIAFNVVLLIGIILTFALLMQRIRQLEEIINEKPVVAPPVIDSVPPLTMGTIPDDPLATWKS